jgi:hypothetical protein
MPKKLLHDRPYTFSNYFEMGIIASDLAKEFGYHLQKQQLELPEYKGSLDKLVELQQRISEILPYLDSENETARREFMIAPIIAELVHYSKARIRVEYSLKLSDQLQGVIDYHLQTQETIVIIEAKQADVSRGFTQLTAELIALDQWIESPQSKILGAVTTGNIWQFGILERSKKLIQQGLNLYRVPEDLDQVFRILLHFLVN